MLKCVTVVASSFTKIQISVAMVFVFFGGLVFVIVIILCCCFLSNQRPAFFRRSTVDLTQLTWNSGLVGTEMVLVPGSAS